MPELSTTDPCALLTVRDVAAWLRVHPKTVYGWASRQAIPTLKIQGALRFRREDLLSFIEAAVIRQEDATSQLKRPRHSHQADVTAVVKRVKRLLNP
jgi:excisionase family DNA binding protein